MWIKQKKGASLREKSERKRHLHTCAFPPSILMGSLSTIWNTRPPPDAHLPLPHTETIPCEGKSLTREAIAGEGNFLTDRSLLSSSLTHALASSPFLFLFHSLTFSPAFLLLNSTLTYFESEVTRERVLECGEHCSVFAELARSELDAEAQNWEGREQTGSPQDINQCNCGPADYTGLLFQPSIRTPTHRSQPFV